MDIPEKFEHLFNKNNNIACKTMLELSQESDKNDSIYPYVDRMREMLKSKNSYIRTRGLTLLAHNAKWDRENRLKDMLPDILSHITDEKPITSRQCIKLLPIIARDKPELKEEILTALENADVSFYKDSMQPLVYKDIKEAINEIKNT